MTHCHGTAQNSMFVKYPFYCAVQSSHITHILSTFKSDGNTMMISSGTRKKSYIQKTAFSDASEHQNRFVGLFSSVLHIACVNSSNESGQ